MPAPLLMTEADLSDFLEREFPQVAGQFEVRALAPMRVTLAMRVAEMHLRPGGTVSGPAMFALADVASYLAILAMIGPRALAVTTSSSMDFMRKPAAGQDLCAEAELLKLGRVLAVADVRLFSGDEKSAPVARATMTYSLPKT